MATVQSPPILIYEPGGGVSVGPVSNPPVYSQAGTTPLVEDQAYIDVVFGSVQTTDEWVLVECIVVNELDVDPLNIWPGIITDKTQAGFRLQLNGMPDSGNYYLHWAVSGVNITPSPANTYFLSGPATGGIHVDSTAFTVSLPPSTTVPGTVIVIPDDGGLGGTFTPASVTLTSSSRTATFTYTPTIYGAAVIGVTNSGGLIDPASIAFTCVATGYGFTGPTTGGVGVASTDFTVELPTDSVVIGTVTVTPSDGGDGGAFTPTTATLTTAAPLDTFTYTPASSGAKTISVTNNGGLTDPGNISYVSTPFTMAGLKLWLKADAIAGPPADGTAIATWADSSGLGNDATQSTAGFRPLFKTNRINALPALKFDGVDDYLGADMLGSVTTSASIFIVQRKNAISPGDALVALANPSTPNSASNTFEIHLPYSDGTVYFDIGDITAGAGRISAAWGGDYTNFFVWSFVAGGGNMAVYRNGTTVVSSGGKTNVFTPAGLTLGISGYDVLNIGQDADVAEILIFNVGLSTTDRQNVENYLLAKYAL